VMRSVFKLLASWVILIFISSCSTVPTGPLQTGELRLLKIQVEGDLLVNIASKVRIQFDSDGKPEIRRVCSTWSGDERSCVKVTKVEHGSPGEIMFWITPRRQGNFVLECYAEYTREGKAYPSNKLAVQASVAPF
jgi:hypothetical protein